MVLWHVTTRESLDRILAEGLEPRIGERSTDGAETIPAIYTFRSYDDMRDALGSWLGEEFDEDTELAVIELQAFPDHLESEAFETRIFQRVDPSDFLGIHHEDDIV